MIYCNYDELQFEFSKTYRCIDTHDEFFHLGKTLKHVIHTFGVHCGDGNVHTFYHGVSEQLLFPHCIVDRAGFNPGICVRCPLSTTESFAVAMNFTNYNHGMIVEFGHLMTCAPKYFYVSWLSDYPNEREYLFMQNEGIDGLLVQNIINIKHGIEYKMIITALKKIEQITQEDDILRLMEKSILTINASEEMIGAIVSNQLSKKLPQYQLFCRNNPYLQNLCNKYFQNTRIL
eukprot:1670_1